MNTTNDFKDHADTHLGNTIVVYQEEDGTWSYMKAEGDFKTWEEITGAEFSVDYPFRTREEAMNRAKDSILPPPDHGL